MRYKNNKSSGQLCWLEIFYFYISQTKSSLDRMFYMVVYHHIIYTCDFFFVNLNDFFAMIYTSFHEGCGFHQIHPPDVQVPSMVPTKVEGRNDNV